MPKNLKYKIILIVLIFFGSLYYLYPTFYLYRLSPEERRNLNLSDPQDLKSMEERSIKLGLDLQGGMHLVLELDKSNMSMTAEEEKDAVSRALEIIRTRVDQFGVSEPIIQKAGDDRIIVELAGVVDTARARMLVEQSAYLEFKLVKSQSEFNEILKLADEVILENDLVLLTEEKKSAEDRAAQVQQKPEEKFNPMELFKASETDTSQAGEKAADTTLAQEAEAIPEELLPGEKAVKDIFKTPLSSLFYNQPARGSRQEGYLLVPLNKEPLVKEYLSLPLVAATITMAEVENRVDYLRYKSQDEGDEPDSLEVLWGDDDTDMVGPDGVEYKKIYLMKKSPEMTGEYLADASATLGSGYDPSIANKPLVLMNLDGAGTDLFADISEKYLQRDLAIVLDKVVKFAPRIVTRIPNGRAQIEGVPTMEKARDLSIVLRAGALPAPLIIAESRVVGPSLGADSIQKSSRSAIIGFMIVVLFMIIYYRFGGLVANVALILDMLIILAVLAGFNATLTLPGIAGLILTIGMAVDANVLIFERIREELRSGKTLRAAIDTGYERAFTTILDSNLTTFITAVVLFQFGTGPIKGFAVVLSIGLAASMFTAIFVTRVVFDLWTSRKTVKTIAL